MKAYFYNFKHHSHKYQVINGHVYSAFEKVLLKDIYSGGSSTSYFAPVQLVDKSKLMEAIKDGIMTCLTKGFIYNNCNIFIGVGRSPANIYYGVSVSCIPGVEGFEDSPYYSKYLERLLKAKIFW